MPILTEVDEIRPILMGAKTVAVLGAHPQSSRPAHYVPAYLHEQGIEILPVNPGFTGQTLFGAPVHATLSELGCPIDIVDIFRHPRFLPDHLDDILAMDPLPHCVWFQSGIIHDDVAAQLSEAGLHVVQDRCTYADHRRWR